LLKEVSKSVTKAKKALADGKKVLIGIHATDGCGAECLIPWDGKERHKQKRASTNNKVGDIKVKHAVSCCQCGNRDMNFDFKRSTSSDEDWESAFHDEESGGNYVHLETAEAIDSWSEMKKLAIRDHILSKESTMDDTSETDSATKASDETEDSKPSAAAASKPPPSKPETKKKKRRTLNLDSTRVSSSSANSDGLAVVQKDMAASAPEKKKKGKKKRSSASAMAKSENRKAMGDLTNTDNPPVEQRRRKKKKAPPPSHSSSDSDSSSFSLPKRITTRKKKGTKRAKRAKPAPPPPDSDTSDEEVLDDRFCSQMKLLPYSPDSLDLDYDRGEYVLDSEIDKVSIPENETLLSRLEFGDGVFVRRSSRQWAYGIFVKSEVFITREYKVQFACGLRTKGQFVEKGASYFEGEKIRLIKGSRHLSLG